MNEHLVKFWLFATHWTELDTFDTEEELNDEIELLHRQNLPTKVRQRTKKDGGEELVLYVKQADRDYARYCTGWRPGMMSGYLSDWLGYRDFFIWVLIATIPAFIVTWLVPFTYPDGKKK